MSLPMSVVESIHFSLHTLLGVMLVPFLFFTYRARHWYRPDIIRRYDLLLGFVAAALALAVMAKMVTTASSLDAGGIQLGILHLLPLVLTLILVRHRQMAEPFSALKGGLSERDGYRPEPVNASIEKLTWEDIVIEPAVRDDLSSVVELLRTPKTAARYGIGIPKGILLYGPPGTGKTTVAKVMANMAGMSFFNLRLDEVISKWVGESEKNLSRLFDAAKAHAPAIIFVDEIDSIGKSRSGQVQWADNLLNHLLQLIDGVVKTEGLYIIAATNRPDLVDEALKRSGRLSRAIEIPLPDRDARKRLFELGLTKLRLSDNLSLDALADLTPGLSGADIKEICNQAGLRAFQREATSKQKSYIVTKSDFESALSKFR